MCESGRIKNAWRTRDSEEEEEEVEAVGGVVSQQGVSRPDGWPAWYTRGKDYSMPNLARRLRVAAFHSALFSFFGCSCSALWFWNSSSTRWKKCAGISTTGEKPLAHCLLHVDICHPCSGGQRSLKTAVRETRTGILLAHPTLSSVFH